MLSYRSILVTFSALSGLAFLTLWILMTLNGVLVALLKAAWHAQLPNGTSLSTEYTGLLLIDFPLRILVAFFYGLQALDQPGTVAPYLLLVDLVATLLVLNMMTLVESCRVAPPRRLGSSLAWQYGWNCTGVALCYPLYAFFQVKDMLRKDDASTSDNSSNRNSQPRNGPSTTSTLPQGAASALIPTAVWSLLLPIPLLVPSLLGWSALHIQAGFLAYLFTPVLLVAFHSIWTAIFSSTQALKTTSTENDRASTSRTPLLRTWPTQPLANKEQTAASSARSVTIAYIIVGVGSMVLHLMILAYVQIDHSSFSSSPDLSLIDLYLPSYGGGLHLPSTTISDISGANDKHDTEEDTSPLLTIGALVFFQWDYILIHLTVIFHALVILSTIAAKSSLPPPQPVMAGPTRRQRQQQSRPRELRERQRTRDSVVHLIVKTFAASGVSLLLGPGALLAYILAVRENQLGILLN